MKKIAITGGIGSGKSTVSEIIRKMGYVVVSADKVYSELLLNEDFVKEICELMNISPIEKDGRITIDRKALSALVFTVNNVYPIRKRNVTVTNAGKLCA